MDEFVRWFYEERKALIQRMMEGRLRREDMLVGFMRHTPAVVSHGPGGLNASIKGAGIVHREEFLEETNRKMLKYLRENPRPKPRTAARFLLSEVYRDELVDFSLVSTIELAKRHTYANLGQGGEATLLFYEPPEITYEVRCEATCHHEGPYFTFVNALHDIFHGFRGEWDTPVYIFKIKEIYDNNPKYMGRRIY